MSETNELHIPDLHIDGFRGIEKLDIPRLGRVTLLVGKNGVGKTTVLEAVRAYAARGRSSTLAKLLLGREETLEEKTGLRIDVDWPSLFYNRGAAPQPRIAIGPKGDLLNIDLVSLPYDSVEPDNEESLYDLDPIDLERISRGIQIAFRQRAYPPWPLYRLSRIPRDVDLPPEIDCEFAQVGVMGNDDLDRLWNKAAAERREDLAIQPLQEILGLGIEDILVLGAVQRTRSERRAMAGVSGQTRRVPLKSLGGGAFRLFSIALALANSRNGILLLDEAENGLHHSIQSAFWRVVFQMAEANNIQALATTHSFDCVQGFAQAATDSTVDGTVIRLEKDADGLYPVGYSEEELATAAEHGIEVR